MGSMDIGGFGTASQDYYYLRGNSQRLNIDSQFAVQGRHLEKKAPYSYLADGSGLIMYKGVVFQCDDKTQTISLGYVSDEKNVLRIPLSGGGTLLVNREKLGDLSRAISMFSAEDVGLILRAIAEDTHCRRKLNEIDELENTVPDTASGDEDKPSAGSDLTTA